MHTSGATQTDKIRRVGISRAQANRAIRQEAMREQLAAQKLVEKVIDTAHKLSTLSIELSPTEVTRLKHSADLRLKLIDKYLPDLKAVEHTGSGASSSVELSDAALIELLKRHNPALSGREIDAEDAVIIEPKPLSADPLPADTHSDALQGPTQADQDGP